jgi:hypothetical protein
MSSSKIPEDRRITVEKVNDIKVKPLKTSIVETRPYKGFQMFREGLPNVMCCAKKKSGKTQTICNIIKHCADIDTQIVVISSTVNKDPAWSAMKKWCKDHNIGFEGLTEIRSIVNGRKADFLEQFSKEIMTGEEEELSSEEEEEVPHCSRFADQGMDEPPSPEYSEEEEEPRILTGTVPSINRIRFSKPQGSIKQQKPYITPAYIVVIDDLSNELRIPSIQAFLKKNRHGKAMTITSSQYLNDWLPMALKNIDVFLLWKGLSIDKLEKIKKDSDLSIPIEIFEQIYKKATEAPFHFLYVNARDDEYRWNFDKRFNIPIQKE